MISVFSSTGVTILQFSTGGVHVDDLDISLETVGSLTATHDPVTDTYSVTVPTLSQGNYPLAITATNAAGTFQSNHTVHSLDPIAGFTVSTVYGDLDPNTQLKITDLTFAEATSTGFNLTADILSGGNVTITVNWADGTSTVTEPPLDVNHVYSTGGDYSIIITADSPLG